ncbi:hypothetical protein GYMLUDRAFT_45754 [Collybiopsis luxurians FD-317 M1]|uniref:Uncharacterized protein n=1 Tax=Collybiopsis luxurians FD-317 M1 TaxID=944289 RepID=A0A0D0C601_9AGAR|nr:hypothetical protein GYMLUDRAFT_45754 [Collybiopsis luxurians FD-317 M1]
MLRMRSDFTEEEEETLHLESLGEKPDDSPPWPPNGPSGGGLFLLGDGLVGMTTGGDKHLCICLGEKHKPTCKKFS